MNFQNVLTKAQEAIKEGKTILAHCNNWPEIIWVAFKKDEVGKQICTIFIKKEDGKFSVVNGARFNSFEIEDLVADWEIVNL